MRLLTLGLCFLLLAGATGCGSAPLPPVPLSDNTAGTLAGTWQVVMIDVRQLILPEPGSDEVRGRYSGAVLSAATAFAVGPHELVTNAHVVNAIRRVSPQVNFPLVLAVQHETGETVRITGAWLHPDYVADSSVESTPDLAILRTDDALPATLLTASSAELAGLQLGEYVTVCGFPGGVRRENVFDSLLEPLRPRATCTSGRLTELLDFGNVWAESPADRRLLLYNIATAPGSSGSPIVDIRGAAIGVHTFAYPESGRGGGARMDEVQRLRESIRAQSVPLVGLPGVHFAIFCGSNAASCAVGGGDECDPATLDPSCVLCDADCDGWTDGSELDAGSDPCAAADQPMPLLGMNRCTVHIYWGNSGRPEVLRGFSDGEAGTFQRDVAAYEVMFSGNGLEYSPLH